MTQFTIAKAKRATRADRWVSFNSRPIAISALYLLTRVSRVLKVPGIGLVVSDAGVMRQILMDGEHFSKTAPGGTSDLWDPVLRGPGLLNMSGEDHLDLKRKLSPLFSAKYLEEAIGAAVTGETDRLAKRLLSGESVDIVKSIEVTAARVICTLSGYDLDNTEEAEVLAQLERARGLMRFVKLKTRSFSDEQVKTAQRELADLHRSIHEAFDSDRVGTIPHTLKGFGLSKNDTTSVITALVITGTETVLSHLPRFTALLLRSGYLNELDDESNLDAVVQEGLRVTVPTPVMLRGLLSPHEVQGRRVKPGDRILMATIFACQRLGHFDPTRTMPKDYRHIWFGAGVHMCIGLPLAGLEIESYLKMFIEVNRQKPICLERALVRRGTLTAGYRELVISCQTS
jgi:cytochrome P450